MIRALATALLALAATMSHAASSGVALTPVNVSVLGGETKTFSVRFLDAAGRPAANEAVQFVNDACGWFGNNSAVANVRTDANGIASTTFTAFNQGITCWLIAAAAPAQVQFNVLTYTAAQVYMTASLNPLLPKPGQPYKVTSSVMAGLYKLYDQDLSVRVAPGTAAATISPGTGNTGDAGSVAFDVAPDNRIGDYEIEFTWRGKSQRLPVKAPANPLKDMWWAGLGENGWGMSVVQHGDMLFNVIYAYDANGAPTWLVMPGGAWNDDKTAFHGALYRPHGAPFSAYDPGRFVAGDPVGSATLTVVDGSTMTLDYVVDGASGRKTITRQLFAPQETPALASDFGDMWWGGAAQSGWGVALLQQYRTLFGVWFTYDASGKPTWFVMPSGAWTDASTYVGRLYRTTGSPWAGVRYDATAFRSTDAGPFALRIAADGSATLDYTIDGRSGSLGLSRQPF
jgi:hypothetical protein